MTNPLLKFDSLPPFADIKVGDIESAIKTILDDNRRDLKQLLNSLKESNWANLHWGTLVEPLERRDDQLSSAWAPVSHLNGVQNNAELREVYTRCLAELTQYSTEISQNIDLFSAYDKLKKSDEYPRLTQAQRKTVDNALRDFRLAGVDLPEEKRLRYSEIVSRLSELSTRFSNNVLDATQGWYKHIEDENQLSGLTTSALAGAHQAAAERELQGWVFTLDAPSYIPIMTHADNRNLREEMYRGFVTRASENGLLRQEDGKSIESNQWDNQELITEILSLRYELSVLLGFENYAQYSLETKMAQSEQQVYDFIQQLVEASKPAALAELAELKQFALEKFDVKNLEAWDITYYSEKLRQDVYAISEEELRPYFPANTVKNGLFQVASKLFDIEIKRDETITTWHTDAEYFQVSRNGSAIAGFYLDLYSRSDKRGGAWMAGCRSRRKLAESHEQQLPVAFLTCNFMPPTETMPSLLTHSDVCTLFHEFGHGLHHMLTQIDPVAVGGINGVAWDAVELPSQFLENWCWQEEVIPMISSHYESGDPLPKGLLEKLLKAKNFQSAMQMLRQLEFSLFDFSLHANYSSEVRLDPQQVIDEVRKKVAVLFPPALNKFQNSFTHIFAGGYAAGYYSYKWAEVLSADAFSLFEKNGLFDSATANSFLNNILEKGGSEEALALFKKFRGREPKVDALLRHSGIGDAVKNI